METKSDGGEEPTEKMSAMEMLSKIHRFWENGKISPDRLDEAAENIARRALEDPTMLSGTSFPEAFGDV